MFKGKNSLNLWIPVAVGSLLLLAFGVIFALGNHLPSRQNHGPAIDHITLTETAANEKPAEPDNPESGEVALIQLEAANLSNDKELKVTIPFPGLFIFIQK